MSGLLEIAAVTSLVNATNLILPLYCIVVFGCSVTEDGAPSPMLAERIKTTAAYYSEKRAEGFPATIVAVGGAVKNSFIEAEAMRDALLSYGIPPSDVITESNSVNTITNAQNVGTQLLQHERLATAQRIRMVVVTSRFHALRSAILLAAVLRTPTMESVRPRIEYNSTGSRTRGLEDLGDSMRMRCSGDELFEPLHEVVASDDFMDDTARVAAEAEEVSKTDIQLPFAARWEGAFFKAIPTLYYVETLTPRCAA